MPITINGSGTITGISAGGLPDGSVVAADLASSLDLTGKTVTLPSGTGGKVLQVVSSTKVDTQSTTSGTFVDISSLSVTITPTNSTSSMLVIANLNLGVEGGNSNGTAFRCVRTIGATTEMIATPTSAGNRTAANGGWAEHLHIHWMGSYGFSHLDTNSDTNSRTYKMQYARIDAYDTSWVNRTGTDADNSTFPRGTSNITVIEVAA